MFKILKFISKQNVLCRNNNRIYQNFRTFLSQAYYCQELWDQRFNSPILQKVNANEFYQELDQRFQKTYQISAIDVDIFANIVQEESFTDELLDVVHKLRLTADTGNTLPSMSHAVVRALLNFGKEEELLNILDDRLNYGLFLDYYTANLLMDIFWKSKQYAHGARVASQLMLQEELKHPLSCDLSLLHCYKYLLTPKGWPEYNPPEEPEEEVKIRVNYLRNPYDDEHFDLRDDKKIVGKTLAMISKKKDDPLNQSFYILGMTLFGKHKEVVELCTKVKDPLYKEILDLVPEDSGCKPNTSNLKTVSVNVNELLKDKVTKTYERTSEQDIADQCMVFDKWEQERKQALEEQKQRLSTAKRLKDIEDLKNAMKEKEEKLWFFENEEKIDLAIAAKKVFYPKRWFGHKKKPKKIDESYVPPEVQNKHIGSSQIS